jgi:hypothetical protein
MAPADCVGVSWGSLSDRVNKGGALARWAAAEPALAGIDTLHELAGIVHDRGRPARADELLGALVRTAAVDGGDDENAAFAVAHLLANGTRRLASRLRDLSSDIDSLVAGELWLQIRTFPWQRRRRAFAASLLLDTRHALLRELRPYRARDGEDRVLLVSPWMPEMQRVPNRAGLEPPGCECDDSRSELLDVLGWAQRSGLVERADVALLVDLVLAADRTAGAGTARRGLTVAAELAYVANLRGVHPQTIRRHRDRTLAALRAARDQYLAAVA